ncbi:MAG: hypothetical protein ACE5K4_12020 [Candidatus Hydrothermarchaeota archaeon]
MREDKVGTKAHLYLEKKWTVINGRKLALSCTRWLVKLFSLLSKKPRHFRRAA